MQELRATGPWHPGARFLAKDSWKRARSADGSLPRRSTPSGGVAVGILARRRLGSDPNAGCHRGRPRPKARSRRARDRTSRAPDVGEARTNELGRKTRGLDGELASAVEQDEVARPHFRPLQQLPPRDEPPWHPARRTRAAGVALLWAHGSGSLAELPPTSRKRIIRRGEGADFRQRQSCGGGVLAGPSGDGPPCVSVGDVRVDSARKGSSSRPEATS